MAKRTRQTKDRRISYELLGEALAGEGAAEAFRNGGLLAEMRKTLAERVPDVEMGHYKECLPHFAQQWRTPRMACESAGDAGRMAA